MIRRALAEDWPSIAAIQRSSPEASQWDPSGYDVTVAEVEGAVAGFLVTRAVAADEIEILNLAVAPRFRRRGVGRALLAPLLASVNVRIFLEVRESNAAARNFYERLNFVTVSRRPDYYENPREASIVMKIHSC